MSEVLDPRNVLVFDTTCRDGSQMPGLSLNVENKVVIAGLLADAGVDIIEAGFPASSEENAEATMMIAEMVEGPIISAFSRTLEPDVEAAWAAIESAEYPRINTCSGTSELHMREVLHKTPDVALDSIVAAVSLARTFTADVQFSAEDASRADPEFLTRVALVAVEAGATTLMIPDTVGRDTPQEYAARIAMIKGAVDAQFGEGHVIVAAHCHNDLGVATANTLAGVKDGGAGQAELTVGGVGERAGNAALEEFTAILEEHPELGLRTNMQTVGLTNLVHELIRRGGTHLQPHKAVVGKNAFTHASGMHQNGVLKNRMVYEALKASKYGQESKIMLSNQSGRAGVNSRLEAMGIAVSEDKLATITKDMKTLANKKDGTPADSEVERLAAEVHEEELFDMYILEGFDSATKSGGESAATVVVNGKSKSVHTSGGPVNAAVTAINELTGFQGDIGDWDAEAVESTAGAEVGAFVEIRHQDGRELTAYATGPSSDEASVRGYLQGVNMFQRLEERKEALTDGPK